MINPEAYLKILANLPPLMKELIQHPGFIDQAIAIEDKYHLNDKQARTMLGFRSSLISHEVAPQVVSNMITQQMNMDPAEAKKFAVDFFGMICLPMQWYVGDVELLIKVLGGDVNHFHAEAKRIFPEVYGIQAPPPQTIITTTPIVSPSTTPQPPILHNLEEKLSSNKGRAGILLHLTNLSLQIEERVAAKSMTPEVGQELIHSLDGLSYAVNTKDLNPLEIAAIKRKILAILAKLGLLTV